MKPFEELSRLGRIRRMRQLAQVALNAYGLSDVRFKLLRQAGNTLFRVNEVDPVPTTKAELARLHGFAAHWPSPPVPTKRKYDWDGLFRDAAGVYTSGRETWSLLPQEYVEPFEVVTRRVKQVMDEWGQGPEVYGLIHGDLGLDANVLFWGGEARAIDFDDSGFGYYVYELSLALEHCQEDDALPQFRDALLDGYTQVRSLPEDQLEHFDLFLAAYFVYLSLYAAGVAPFHPNDREELLRRMARAFRLVERYLADT